MVAKNTIKSILLYLKPRCETVSYLELVSSTLKYIGGLEKAFPYQKFLKTNFDFSETPYKSAKEFRLALVNTSDMFNCKVAYHYILCNKSITKDEFIEYAKHIRLSMGTAGLIWGVFKRCSLPEPVYEVTWDSYYFYMSMFKRIYPDILKHIARVTHSRLRFMLMWNEDLTDIKSELSVQALIAFYKTVPTYKEESHIINAVRATITRQTINIIHNKTANKRSFVTSSKDNEGEWHSVIRCVSENNIRMLDSRTNIPLTFDRYAELTSGSTSSYYEDNIEFKLSLRTLRKRYRKNKKKSLLLDILIGKDVNKFTLWLRENGMIKKDQDYSDYLSDRRRKNTNIFTISKFLGVPVKITVGFLWEICSYMDLPVKEQELNTLIKNNFKR